MPIFDFYCKKCNKTEERLVRRDDIDKQKCNICERKMPKTDEIHKSSFILKGNWK